MKTSRVSFFAFFVFSGSLIAQEPSIAKLAAKLEAFEGKVSDLTSELAATQATLKEVSKLVMTDRLELIVHILGNGRMTLEGKGLNGQELGGKDLDGEEFVKKVKSISEDYPKPRIIVADAEKFIGQDRLHLQQLLGRVGIYTTSVRASDKPE